TSWSSPSFRADTGARPEPVRLTGGQESSMKIAVLREVFAGEYRVAATPGTVGKLGGLGATIAVEARAGAGSRIMDADYAAQGASIVPDAQAALAGAEIVLTVRRPSAGALQGVAPGALVIGALDPYGNQADIAALASAGV